MLLMEQGSGPEALAWFNRAVAADTAFVEARRFRAVLLARLRDFGPASQDINWCLEREPEAGATLYAAACVSALIAARASDGPAARSAAEQALNFLEMAFARGYGRDRAAADPDLAGLGEHPRFRALLAGGEAGHPLMDQKPSSK
jgi:hypothetical protein